MNGVVKSVDLRAFPMEMAKQMLELGNALNMGLGPVAYNEAEIKLLIWFKVLSDYRRMYFDLPELSHQYRASIRFIQLHTNDRNFKVSIARKLLDFMHYFPEDIETGYDYHNTLSEDELH